MNELAMTNTEVKDLTPEQLGGEIRLLTGQARRMALSYAIQIGYRLKVAHDKVGPHGWAEWLKRETDLSQASASRLQALYEGYGEDQGCFFGVGNKFPTLENISISNALRLLVVPEEEREEVAAEVDAEHLSARELEKALAERDEARKALQDTSERLEQAQETLAGSLNQRTELMKKLTAAREDLKAADEEAEQNERTLKDRIKELESRPVEVAVERDEEAIRQAAIDARNAAEEAAKKDLDKLKARLEKAEAAQKKAEAEAKSAAEQAAKKDDEILRSAQDDRKKAEKEAEKAKAEAEELRKKLISAESGANVAAVLFSQAQQSFNAALEKVEAMKSTHPEIAAKLLAGMEQVMGRLLETVKEAR